MEYTVALVGFRHGHVFDVLQRMKDDRRFRVVACCEEDAATRETLARDKRVEMTHQDFPTMLAGADFDVLVVGDYFGKRGSLALSALRAGKSVLSDKPVCTRLSELAAIERELRRVPWRPVLGAMLDLRDAGIFRRMRELVRGGEIGEVHAISFNGNHPLMPTKRPGWYFEKDKQGGTINDLGVHAFDTIPWITGLSFSCIEAARAWATPAVHGNAGGYLASFLRALDGTAGAEDLGTNEELGASRLGLLFQDAAERGRRGVRLAATSPV